MLPSSLTPAAGIADVVPEDDPPAARAAGLRRGFEDVEIASELTLQAQLRIAGYLLSRLGADGLADLLAVPRACVAHPFTPEELVEVVRLDIVADGCGQARLLAIDAGSSIAARDFVTGNLSAQDFAGWDGDLLACDRRGAEPGTALLEHLAGLLRDKLAAAPTRRLLLLDPTPGADTGAMQRKLAPLLPGFDVATAAETSAREGDLVYPLMPYRPAHARLFATLYDAGATVFSPLACELMSSRAWLSLLHHECLQGLLTPRQREAVVAFVPRAFRLNDMSAFVVFEDRDRYMFERIEARGARGTVAGDRAPASLLDAMRRSPKDWIALERVNPTVPDMVAHIAASPRDARFVLYRVGGRYAGGWQAPHPRD